MIYAVLGNTCGQMRYPEVRPDLPEGFPGFKVVILNGTMIDGVHERTGPYCPIRYQAPPPKKARRGASIVLEKDRIPWSHLPPSRKRR